MPRRTTSILGGLAIVATTAAVVVAALYVVREPAERVVDVKPCGERIFGHIASLTETDGAFVLRLDPAGSPAASRPTSPQRRTAWSPRVSPCRTTTT
jgi:hypothetical protein